MFVAKNSKWFVSLLLVLVLVSLFSIWHYGLNLGMDFKGGSLLEVEYPNGMPDLVKIKAAVAPLSLGETIQPYGDKGLIVKARDLKESDRAGLIKALAVDGGQIIDKRFTSIGPTIGNELKTKSVYSIILVVIAITLFIAFAFRQVSGVVKSWEYGLVTVITLGHDVIVPLGIFAYLGHKYGIEIDSLFVTAILTILGFSVHDTIVVFDRIRENIKLKKFKSFTETVGMSIRQTLSRSINTSLAVVLTLVALIMFGSASVKYFCLALIVGIIAGTYSSILLASPLLVVIQSRKKTAK
ncbi:MAG: protein translocase subunit SecF [Candidatus Vogelbacteria bacterium]|nr:protein translocase subunit SecF [Candidatus Vogelbacteria bacterium]